MSTLATAAATTRPRITLLRPAILCVAALGLLIAVPLAVTLTLGDAPYSQLLLQYPGLAVATTTTLLLVGAKLGTLLTFGALIHLLFLRDAPARQARVLSSGFNLTMLRIGASVWAACAGGLILFTALDASGLGFDDLSSSGALGGLWQGNYAPQAWTISFLAAIIALFSAFVALRWTGLLIALWATTLAQLAPVVSGQVLVGPNHDFGSDAAIFQTLAVNLFFGVVALAALRVLAGGTVSATTLRRIRRIGTIALPLIAATTPIIAIFKLAGTSPLASLTGWLLLASGGVVLLSVAVAVAAWARGRASRGGSGRAAAGEADASRRGVHHGATGLSILTLLGAGWLALDVAMSRQPPPQYFVPTSIEQVFMGFNVPDAPSFAVLFGAWRPNLLFLGIAAAGITVYLVAVRTLRRRGDTWPVARTISWVGGWAVVVFATSSGFGKYSAPDFGIHMIVHMSLNMLAPGMLVLGGVVTLLLRVSASSANAPAGPHTWITWVLHWRVAHVIYNPLIVFLAFVGSYYGLYLTGIFGNFMRFHWAHQFMNLHFLIIGYLYYSLSIGVDRPPRPLPHIGKLGYVLAAMPFHAFFGVILMTSPTIIAETFYRYLDLPWANLQAQQYLGGGVAWAGGEIPLLIVVIALGLQWSRQDAREAGRTDRHFDAGRDDEFEAYNRMLRRLAERDAGRVGPAPVAAAGDHVEAARAGDAEASAGQVRPPAAQPTTNEEPVT